MGKDNKEEITFTATVEAYHSRIVIPKKKAALINLKPGDDLIVTVKKV